MLLSKKPKKSLGQNFLIDKNIISEIAKVGNIDNESIVMEIGPGYGSLTESIIKHKPREILLIEKDKYISHILEKKFKLEKNIKIFNKDILDSIKENDFKKKIIVFGNLPYNISTEILASLIMLKK